MKILNRQGESLGRMLRISNCSRGCWQMRARKRVTQNRILNQRNRLMTLRVTIVKSTMRRMIIKPNLRGKSKRVINKRRVIINLRSNHLEM